MFQMQEYSQVIHSIVMVLLRQMPNCQYTSLLCLGAMLAHSCGVGVRHAFVFEQVCQDKMFMSIVLWHYPCFFAVACSNWLTNDLTSRASCFLSAYTIAHFELQLCLDESWVRWPSWSSPVSSARTRCLVADLAAVIAETEGVWRREFHSSKNPTKDCNNKWPSNKFF